jgi:hypothetical protein
MKTSSHRKYKQKEFYNAFLKEVPYEKSGTLNTAV